MKRGFDVHRNFFDALDFGRKTKKAKFAENFIAEIEKFKEGLRKELRVSRGAGELLEKEADPISIDMFERMCRHAIKTGNSFFWSYGLMQWACMARCQNIDDLTFRDITLACDALKVQFNMTKTDKTGQRCSPKHCYGNPKNYTICLNTALAVYFCEINDTWSKENDGRLFLRPRSSKNTAASRYTDSIRQWVEDEREILFSMSRVDHLNGHSMRKGSATYASSRTTVPPPLPSIFHRGEWSLGVIIDIYWKFAEKGDHYLGRILAGLDPDSESFDVLPPHFTVGIGNNHLKKAFHICYGKIVEAEGDNNFTKAILTRCLASLIYHADELQKVVARNSGHPFGNIKLFQNPDLLEDCKKLVTVKPTPGILTVSTGVSPHSKTMKVLNQIVGFLQKEEIEREEVHERIKDTIQETVRETIENKFESNGHLSASSVSNILDEYHKESSQRFAEKIDELKACIGVSTSASNQDDNGNEGSGVASNEIVGVYKLYSYNGKLGWAVPEGFILPTKTKLRDAWNLWVNGNRNYNVVEMIGDREILVTKPIRPFIFFTANNLPCWKQFKSGWLGILRMMMNSSSLSNLFNEVKASKGNLSLERVERTYEMGLDHVLNEVEYLREKNNSRAWSITTWSKNVHFSSIIKNGTTSDKERLPVATRFNKSHSGPKRKMRQSNSSQASMRFRTSSVVDV